MRTNEIFGRGKIKELKRIIIFHNPKNILLITGRNSYDNLEEKLLIGEYLSGKSTHRYFNFKVNPSFNDLVVGTKLVEKIKPDMIIGIGGGSVLDTAKHLSSLPADKSKIEKIIKTSEKIKKRKNILVLIPTTSGSGSESTNFAIVYLNDYKYSVVSNEYIPNYIILDPNLSDSLDKKLTATTALDALCQAIESYWSVNSTEESRIFAAESITLIFSLYFNLLNKPLDIERSLMLKASNLSGKAINITKTTAPHALSYPLTQLFGIPHGHAVSLTLPFFFVKHFYASHQILNTSIKLSDHKNRMFELCRLLNLEKPSDIFKLFKKMHRTARLKSKLKGFGVNTKKKAFSAIEYVNIERLQNNPVIILEDDIKEILSSIL